MGCFSFQMKLRLSALPVNKPQVGQVWGSEITEIEPKKSPEMGAFPVIHVYLNRNYHPDNRSNSSWFRGKKIPEKKASGEQKPPISCSRSWRWKSIFFLPKKSPASSGRDGLSQRQPQLNLSHGFSLLSPTKKTPPALGSANGDRGSPAPCGILAPARSSTAHFRAWHDKNPWTAAPLVA